MLLVSEKIFNVYEKPEAPEPTERMVLLREGFTFWAFIFAPLWLLAKRQWLAFLGFMVVAIALNIGVDMLGLPDACMGVIILWLHLMLGFHANDLRAWALKRKGYRFAGVLAAESAMHAQRRYYEFAA